MVRVRVRVMVRGHLRRPVIGGLPLDLARVRVRARARVRVRARLR